MRTSTALLATGATLRLTRLVVTDEIGQWWVKEPIDRAAERWWHREVKARGGESPPQPWWWKYRSGLDCPFCVGWWASLLVLGAEAITRQNPRAHALWRFGAGALTMSYLVGHVSARLESTEDEGDEGKNE